MKKFLALVLALVMTMSLVTISSSAAQFSDSEDIQYDEAVNVLSALGVINGIENADGSFSYAPNQPVDRASMAKFIVYIKTGSDGASAYATVPTDLTDIESSWAKNAIKYCYANGIISGDGQGHFFPTQTVTTVEAAKMLLVALGYKADVQGYVGDQWKVKVTADATDNKIFEGIDVATDKPLTREETAKLVYNTVVLAETIEESRSQDLTDGSVSVSYGKSGSNLLGETFVAQRYKGIISNVEYQEFDKTYTYTSLNGSFVNVKGADYRANGEELGSIVDFTTADNYTDMANQEVVVLHKVIDGKETVLGVYPTGKTAVEVTAVRDLKVNSDASKLIVNGKTYSLNDFVDLYNGESILAYVDAKSHLTDVETIKLADNFKPAVDENGDPTLAVGPDGKLDTIVPFGHSVDEVTFVDADEIIVGDQTISYKDNKIADGIEAGDYALYYQEWPTETWVVTEVEAFEAEATAVNKQGTTGEGETGDDTYRFNGTYYNDRLDDQGISVGNTYKVWAYNGVIVGYDSIDGTSISNLVLVSDADVGTLQTGKKDKAEYYDVNGESHVVDIDAGKDDDDVLAVGDLGNVGLYMIKKTSKGVQFTAPDETVANSKYFYVDANGDKNGEIADFDAVTAKDGNVDKIGGIAIASDAVVFVEATDGEKVITGAQLKKNVAANVTVVSYYVDDGQEKGPEFDRISHIHIQWNGNKASVSGKTGNELYAYVTESAVEISVNGDPYTEYKIWTADGRALTVTEEGSNDRAKGTVISIDSISDKNVVVVNEVVTTYAGYVATAPTAKSVNINGDNAYDLTGDTKYIYVDSDAATAEEIGVAEGTLKKAQTYAKGNAYVDNILYAVDGDECTVIVVDVKNNMRVSANKYDIGTLSGTYDLTADTSSVRMGDKVTFTSDVAATVTIEGVVDSNGDAIRNKEVAADGKIVAYVVARGDGAVYVA